MMDKTTVLSAGEKEIGLIREVQTDSVLGFEYSCRYDVGLVDVESVSNRVQGVINTLQAFARSIEQVPVVETAAGETPAFEINLTLSVTPVAPVEEVAPVEVTEVAAPVEEVAPVADSTAGRKANR